MHRQLYVACAEQERSGIMRKIKIIISIIMIAALIVTISFVHANAVTLITDGAYTFADISDDYVALYGFDNSSDTLVVPEKLKTRYVNSVFDYAFEDNTSISHIDFSQCSGHFTEIGIRAFSGCTGLTGNLTIPSSVKTLGLAGFENTGLTSVNLNCKVRDIPNQLFNNNLYLEEVHLPINCETIGNLAFANCPKLKDVYFPSSVTSISESAFKSSDYVMFFCFKNTCAHNYAKSHGIPFEILDPVKGDTNGSDKIDINDATLIQKYKAGIINLSKTALRAADVNGDNQVTVRDATLIQMRIANIINEF
jgi:hypothetical protein